MVPNKIEPCMFLPFYGDLLAGLYDHYAQFRNSFDLSSQKGLLSDIYRYKMITVVTKKPVDGSNHIPLILTFAVSTFHVFSF